MSFLLEWVSRTPEPRGVTKNVSEVIVCGGILVTSPGRNNLHIPDAPLITKRLWHFLPLLWEVSDGSENAIHSMFALWFLATRIPYDPK